MEAMECLLGRQSTPAGSLVEPVPDDDEILNILESAMRAPDHGALRPWRFLLIRGAARRRLGDLFADSLRRREPAAEAAEIEKARGKPLRAPLVMAIWAEITEGIAKVPPVEQLVATAAATQNMLNALHAKGYGAILVTGAPCYDEAVKAALGLAAKDHLLGFVHIGTPNGTAAGKQRPAPAEFLREWHGPAELAAE